MPGFKTKQINQLNKQQNKQKRDKKKTRIGSVDQILDLIISHQAFYWLNYLLSLSILSLPPSSTREQTKVKEI